MPIFSIQNDSYIQIKISKLKYIQILIWLNIGVLTKNKYGSIYCKHLRIKEYFQVGLTWKLNIKSLNIAHYIVFTI